MAAPVESFQTRRRPEFEEPTLPHDSGSDVAEAARHALGFSALFRHWRLVLACVAALLSVGILYLVVRNPVYTGTTSVLVAGRVANAEAERASLAAQGEIGELSGRIMQLLAEKARLEAEFQDLDAIAFPAELAAPPEGSELLDIIDRERMLFAARKRALDEEAKSLGQALQLYNDEVGSLQQQVEYAAVQQQSLDDELASIRSLVERQLAPVSRQRDLERTAAALASRKIEFDTELLNARQKIVETEQKIADLQSEKHSEILTEIQRVDGEIRSARARLKSAEGLNNMAGLMGGVEPAVVENQLELIRSDGNALRVVEAANLVDDQDFLFSNDPATASDPSDEVLQSDDLRKRLAVYVLQENVTAKRVGRGSRIDIAFVSSDPRRAAAIADAAAAVYVGGASAGLSDSASPPMPGSSSQILRSATVVENGPGAVNVLIAVLFVGLALGTGAAYVLEFVKSLRAGAGRRATAL